VIRDCSVKIPAAIEAGLAVFSSVVFLRKSRVQKGIALHYLDYGRQKHQHMQCMYRVVMIEWQTKYNRHYDQNNLSKADAHGH
jgi:hypothetical protein